MDVIEGKTIDHSTWFALIGNTHVMTFEMTARHSTSRLNDNRRGIHSNFRYWIWHWITLMVMPRNLPRSIHCYGDVYVSALLPSNARSCYTWNIRLMRAFREFYEIAIVVETFASFLLLLNCIANVSYKLSPHHLFYILGYGGENICGGRDTTRATEYQCISEGHAANMPLRTVRTVRWKAISISQASHYIIALRAFILCCCYISHKWNDAKRRFVKRTNGMN